MTIAYLNGDYVPLEEAKISPMDRGFLFGDGIYEVIPSYGGKTIGTELHMVRFENGLREIGIEIPWARAELTAVFEALLAKNGNGNLGIYLQVTRGVTMKRNHAFPQAPTPTIFAYTFDIPEPDNGNRETVKQWRVTSGKDLRWQRCHIKSTSLLGNVLHMMEGVGSGAGEIILFDAEDNLTEAAACNVFVVTDGIVRTPPLDNHKLAGVTRDMVLAILRKHSALEVREEPISRQEVIVADEVWLSSSTKELEPVVTIDDKPVGTGEPGPVWSRVQALFAAHRFDHFA